MVQVPLSEPCIATFGLWSATRFVEVGDVTKLRAGWVSSTSGRWWPHEDRLADNGPRVKSHSPSTWALRQCTGKSACTAPSRARITTLDRVFITTIDLAQTQ